MKILIVSCSPWREDNSIGNSYTNIFQGIKNIEIAHICCGSGEPNTEFVKTHFHINERNIIKNILNKENKIGFKVPNKSEIKEETLNKKQNPIMDFMKIHRFQIFFWARDIIWSFKNWISPELKEFVDDFNPDIIFAPFLDTKYLNEMLIFLKEYTSKPLIVYAWDDVYTLNQFSFSPFYWINRLDQRRKLKKVADISLEMYTISKIQQQEYSKLFNKDCKLLYKGYKFDNDPKFNRINSKPIKFVFTGNIAQSRWKTLAQIGEALRIINKDEVKAQLIIYSNSPINNKIRKAFDIEGSVLFKGAVPNSQVNKIQQEADVLVHVESFDKKEKLKVRMSFSTKLVDYFNSSKCIFAVGSIDVASIDYLLKNDAAIVSTSKNEIITNLRKIIENKSVIEEYNRKAWECGKRNHNIDDIQKMLYKTLNYIAQKTY